MKIKQVDRQQWDDFLTGQQAGNFLQSALWSAVAREPDCLRLVVIDDDDNLLAGCQLLTKKIKVGHYWFAPRGPIFKTVLSAELRAAAWQILAAELLLRAQAAGIIFCRLEPDVELSVWQFDHRLKATIALEPKQTLLIDLTKSDDELLSEMHQKTRYNIRLAEKKGVTVRRGSVDDFSTFWKLMTETGTRDAFGVHSRAHYERMLIASGGMIELWLAEYQGEVLAAGLFARYGQTYTYIHGASSNSQRQMMAPYLLHWRMMQTARLAKATSYDLFGVDSELWPGVTRFKIGFGGQLFNYPGTFDLVVRPVYYKIYQWLRKIRRSL